MTKAGEQAKHAIGQMAISDDELNKLLDTEVDMMLKETDDDIMTHLVPVCREKFKGELITPTYVAFADLPETGEKRRDAFKALGVKLSDELFYKDKPAKNPVAVIFTSEMWYMPADEKDDENKDIHDYKQKKEGVVIHVLTLDGRNAMAMLDITRDKKNKPTRKLKLLMPYKLGQKGGSESYLQEAFFQGVALYAHKHPQAES